ncbi:MAG: TRAP transporter small permease [Desulfobulbaceae bacterium]|nr:TRAP transporter small permease [Desulfobulbaceae bacterium]
MEDNSFAKELPDGFPEKVVRVTKSISCFYISVLLIGMGLILAASIILRFFFDQPIAWSNTITRYAYIHIVLLGAAVSYIEGSHAQIEVFYERASDRLKLVFDLVHYSAMLFLCLVLTVMGAKHVVSMWHVHSPILVHFPIGVVYLAVPLCAVIMMIFIFQQLIRLKDRK